MDSGKMEELRERAELSTQGRIVIPKPIREKLEIKKGSILQFTLTAKNKIIMEVLTK